MQKIWSDLSSIRTLLEQIYVITQNQTTVLLEAINGACAIDILEEMFNYKNTLMNELEETEKTFQEAYKAIRPMLEGNKELIRLKDEVGGILNLKDQIITIEQKNTLLMNHQRKSLAETIEIPRSSIQVIEAYKKHTKNGSV